MTAWVINTALTCKYGTNDLNLNKYTHTIKINYAKASF